MTDTAGFLSPATAQALNDKLGEYQRSSGHQLLVWIGESSQGDPLDDWGPRVFKAWRLGRKGIDDGVVLFVMATDHAARIEVGYGLEAKVPDAVASHIVNDLLIPRVKAGDRDGEISIAVDKLVSAVGGVPGVAEAQKPTSINLPETILLFLAIIAVVIFGFRYPVFGYYLLFILSSITGRGGGGASARGGGGRSGGGGGGGKW